jgi:hypothetical protein
MGNDFCCEREIKADGNDGQIISQKDSIAFEESN